MTAFTVTAQVGSGTYGASLYLYVLTGAAGDGGTGATAANYDSSSPITVSLTPTASNSLIVFGIIDSDNGGNPASMFAGAANNAIDRQYGITGSAVNWCTGHYTGTVTAGNAVTVGATDAAFAPNCVIAALEVKPSGGSTPVIDSTAGEVPSPAYTEYTGSGQSGNYSLTTGSFTPPAGSLLVAVVSNEEYGSSLSCGMSDTSGLGLTWTPVKVSEVYGNYFVGTWIFVAQMPGGGGTTYAKAGGAAGRGCGTGNRSLVFTRQGGGAVRGCGTGVADQVLRNRQGGAVAVAAGRGSRSGTYLKSGGAAAVAAGRGLRSGSIPKSGGAAASGTASGAVSIESGSYDYPAVYAASYTAIGG